MSWKKGPIFKREDGSYVIVINDAPYHVPNKGEWRELYAEVAEFYDTSELVRAEREFTYEALHPELTPAPTEEELAALALEQAKAERAAAVAAITVEVDGMVFDGDETSQERMARTITAATATGASMDDTTAWVLNDNTVATPTIRQLATALRLAGEEQTRLWTIPYESKEESYYTPAEAA